MSFFNTCFCFYVFRSIKKNFELISLLGFTVSIIFKLFIKYKLNIVAIDVVLQLYNPIIVLKPTYICKQK